MKTINKALFLFLILAFSSTTVTNAEVFSHVENYNIDTGVENPVISPDGKVIYSTAYDVIYIHTRNTNTGKITGELQTIKKADLNSSPDFKFSVSPNGMVISPNGKQLYVSTSFGFIHGNNNPALEYSGSSILTFDIDATGKLTYRNRIISGTGTGMGITNNGKLLFTGSNGASARLAVFKRASNGNLTKLNTYTKDLNNNKFTGTQVIRVSPDDSNLYVSSDSDGHLYIFDLNTDTGALTSTQTFYSGSSSKAGDTVVEGSGGTGMEVSKDGKFLYSVAGYGGPNDSITIFKRNTNGNLTFKKNVLSPIDNPAFPSLRVLDSASANLLISPNQKYLYTYDDLIDVIGVWKRNRNTGDLTFVGKINDNLNTIGSYQKMIVSPDGKFLYLDVERGLVVFDLRTELSLVKSDAVDPVNVSSIIDYTLAITNETGANAYNVVITDTLPSNTSFVSGSVNSNTGACSASGQTVTCTMGEVLSGDGYNAVIKVRAPSTKGQITNTATVTSDQLDKSLANNTDTETTNIGSGGTTPTTPSTGGSGGGSMPTGFLALMLIPLLLRIRKKISLH